MKRSPKYRDEPIGQVEVVSDFLPPPDKLVLRDDGVKVTISLSKRSVDFFKQHAARSKVLELPLSNRTGRGLKAAHELTG
jgi:hypothetical protein